MKLLNAFSLNMLDSSTPAHPHTVQVAVVSLTEARLLAAKGLDSCVGHADTAAVFAAVLGTKVPMTRVTVTLSYKERCLVGQYTGPRLPEGATALPQGAEIKWLLVTVV